MSKGIMHHLVFDMETLGTRDESVVLSFGCVSYHLEKDAGASLKQLQKNNLFYRKLDVRDQVENLGRKIDHDTIQWWKEQGPEAQTVLRPSEEDVTAAVFLKDFDAWIKNIGYDPKDGIAWQRGTVDIAWLDSLCKQLGQVHSDDRSIRWHRVRDIRTAVDALGFSSRFNGIPDGFFDTLKVEFPQMTKHNAGDDCIAQVLQLRMCGVFPEEVEDEDIPF